MAQDVTCAGTGLAQDVNSRNPLIYNDYSYWHNMAQVKSKIGIHIYAHTHKRDLAAIAILPVPSCATCASEI